jgi:hypothetical protein
MSVATAAEPFFCFDLQRCRSFPIAKEAGYSSEVDQCPPLARRVID